MSLFWAGEQDKKKIFQAPFNSIKFAIPFDCIGKSSNCCPFFFKSFLRIRVPAPPYSGVFRTIFDSIIHQGASWWKSGSQSSRRLLRDRNELSDSLRFSPDVLILYAGTHRQGACTWARDRPSVKRPLSPPLLSVCLSTVWLSIVPRPQHSASAYYNELVMSPRTNQSPKGKRTAREGERDGHSSSTRGTKCGTGPRSLYCGSSRHFVRYSNSRAIQITQKESTCSEMTIRTAERNIWGVVMQRRTFRFPRISTIKSRNELECEHSNWTQKYRWWVFRVRTCGEKQLKRPTIVIFLFSFFQFNARVNKRPSRAHTVGGVALAE